MKSREFYNASFAIAGQAFILFLARALFFSNPPPETVLFEPRSCNGSTRIEASRIFSSTPNIGTGQAISNQHI